jgi:hypothetical protein
MEILKDICYRQFSLRRIRRKQHLTHEQRPWVLFIAASNEETQSDIVLHLDEISICEFERFTVLRDSEFQRDLKALSGLESALVEPIAQALVRSAEKFLLNMNANIVRYLPMFADVETHLRATQDLFSKSGQYYFGLVYCRSNSSYTASAFDDETNLFKLTRPQPQVGSNLIDLLVFVSHQNGSSSVPKVTSVVNSIPSNFSKQSFWQRSFGRILHEHMPGSTQSSSAEMSEFRYKYVYETPIPQHFDIQVVQSVNTTTTDGAASANITQHSASVSLIAEIPQSQKLKLFISHDDSENLVCVEKDVREAAKHWHSKVLHKESGVVYSKSMTTSLSESFASEQPFMWFLACHGNNANGATERVYLKLHNRNYTDEEIAKLCIAQSKSNGGELQVVILSCCNSKALGELLHKGGIPYVICWDGPCVDEACSIFSQAFFVKFTKLIQERKHLLPICFRIAFDEAKQAVLEKRNDSKFQKYEYEYRSKLTNPKLMDVIVKANKDGTREKELRVQLTQQQLEENDIIDARDYPIPCGVLVAFSVWDADPRHDNKGIIARMKWKSPSIAVSPRANNTNGFFQAETELFKLDLSPLNRLSLNPVSQERALIPSGSAYYSYCHPPESEAMQEWIRSKLLISQSVDGSETKDPYYLRPFLQSGGFLYFNENLTCIGLNVLHSDYLPAFHGVGLLNFSSKAQALRFDMAVMLAKLNRLHPDYTKKLFVGWIRPKEEITIGAPIFDHGAFVTYDPLNPKTGIVDHLTRSG